MMHRTITRRELCVASALTTATIATSPLATSSASAGEPATNRAETPPLVDTHLHCFAGTNDTRFPYHARAPYRPTDVASPEHLIKCMDAAGVSYAVVVHPEPYQDDHRYLEHCLEVGGKRLKGTILLFSDRPGSLDQMPELCRKLDVVCVRVHAYAPGRLPPWTGGQLRRLWTMATDLGLAVQLHFEPRYAPQLEPYIREFRATKVVIDHLGRPFQGTPDEHEVVLRWAELDNTVMKLSSIPPQTSYPHRDIAPVIRKITDAWGAARIMYGGGFNAAATGQSYSNAFERGRSYLSHLAKEQQDMILGGTAVGLYGFGA